MSVNWQKAGEGHKGRDVGGKEWDRMKVSSEPPCGLGRPISHFPGHRSHQLLDSQQHTTECSEAVST